MKYDKYINLNNITKIPISKFTHLLNDFGRAALLTGDNLSSYAAQFNPQLYEGTLGDRLHFYLLFRRTFNNQYEGTYAYKKIGKAIALSGELKDLVYTFEEYDHQTKKVAIMSFKHENGQLIGFWAKADGEKWKLVAHRK